MGRSARVIPKRLGEKLKKIRLDLRIDTYEEMIERLDCPEIALYPSSIFLFEANRREPSLKVLLKYARLRGVPMDALVDDEIDL